MPSVPLPRFILCALLAFSSIAASARAQDAAAGYPAPTVTPEMGDVGGKIFGKEPDLARTRHYYIAAEPELWNFAPEGQDPVCGKTFPPQLQLNRVAWKIRYVQYADADFSARVLPAERLGIMGPALRGVVGDYIAVTLLNRSWQPVSMHPHGLRYDKDNEGSYYKPEPGLGAAIAPGAKFTYVWHLDEASGPRADEPSSKAWLYHSHVGGDDDINMGLIGFIIVTDPARARPDGTPRDVDREMATLFNIFDESGVPDADGDEDDRVPNQATGPIQRTWAETQQMAEEGERHTINGRVFGNLRGLEMNEGERVRWYVFGLGSEKDFHTAHWHGLRVLENGRRQTDTVELLPASMKVADSLADNPGQWLLHCHVADHMNEGMFARVTVHPRGGAGVSCEPEAAFFGMPTALQTLRISLAELVQKNDPAASEIVLTGQVTVPDPFPVSRHEFTAQIGHRKMTLHPDASGLCVGPEGLLLVKNISPRGNGNVIGGTLEFELSFKGASWLDELRQMHVLDQNGPAPGVPVSVSLTVGKAHHSAVATLKPVVD